MINSRYSHRSHSPPFLRVGMLIIFMIILRGHGGVEGIEQDHDHNHDEICEDETINTQYCQLRPGIHAQITEPRTRSDAYLVCEADILPPCSESVQLEEQPESARNRLTTSTTTTTLSPSTATTSAPASTSTTTSVTSTTTTATTTTTIPISTLRMEDIHDIPSPEEKCPSCITICDVERSRCDMSEPILTSHTTIEINQMRVVTMEEQEEPLRPISTSTSLPSTPSEVSEVNLQRQQQTSNVDILHQYHQQNPTRNHEEGYEEIRQGESGRSFGQSQYNRSTAFRLYSLAENEAAKNFNLSWTTVGQFRFPKIVFDTFRKQPIFRHVKTFGEIKDQLHMLKSGDGGPMDEIGHRAQVGRRRQKRSTESQARGPSSNGNWDDAQMSASDEQKLSKLYGPNFFKQHRQDFMKIKNMDPHEDHIPPTYNPSTDEIQNSVNQVRAHYLKQQMQRRQRQTQFPFAANQEVDNQQQYQLLKEPVTQSEIRRTLQELLQKLDMSEQELRQGQGQPLQQGEPQESSQNQNLGQQQQVLDRCTLHGLWLSAVTGIGIQLEPISDHEVTLHVIDLTKYTGNWAEGDEPYEPFISSDWSGRAVISTESATTISIILQERWIDHDTEPRTAVFVGQCIICSGSPTIQGTWIMFPKSQTCYEEISEKVPPRADVMYFLN